MKQTILALLTWLACLTPATAADTDSLLYERQENFERFTRQFPTERVYLHFDNTSYYKGESIWYKAYVVRDDNLHHTDLSRILYVELLNPIGYPVETQKLVIENGQANGSFELKDTLNAGFYEVRAYTAWMLNFTTGDEHGWWRMHSKEALRQWGPRVQRYVKGNAGIFSRVFPVYERVERGEYSKRRMPRLPKATATTLAPIKDRLKMDFYPEGGNLVRDVPGRVAFQAHNAEGRTLNVAGALYRRGDSIGYFKTDYAGRGVFAVTPDSLDAEELTKGLELRLTYQGHDYSFDLPRPKRRGYTLNVFHSGHQLKVIAARNARTDGRLLGLSITSRGHTYYYNTIDLQDDLQTTALIDQHSLQTGVNVVTLFTDEGKTIAQRLVFVNNHDMDGYKLTPLPSGGAGGGLAPYQKVALDYQLTDTAGRPVEKALDFSIAVTDGYTREETYDDGNVLSYLLLASEVKGFIPHPEYYFEADDNERRQALDMLLMVQGWTRYDYEQMMSGSQFEPMLDIERGLTFAGRVWDDNDYEQRIFWKQQLNKPYWVYSEMYINGDTLPYRDHSLDDWMYPADDFHVGGFPQIILTGEARVDTTGRFRLNVTPFYGKGRIALMLNKESIEKLGLMKGGVNGHNFRWNTIKRPAYLVGKRIEPLNQYSPLPKNYDYYETAALVDPIDRDMFRYGFMAAPKEMKGKLIYYDPVSQTYVTPEVVKKKHRQWSDFRDISPVSVMDVKDIMAWLSNIFGDIQDFGPRHPDPFAGGGPIETHTNFVTRMAMEDAIWLDHVMGGTHYRVEMSRNLARNNDINHFDEQSHYGGLNEMLYIFGLDGMNNTYVNAGLTGGEPHYTTATGAANLLPLGLRFFPIKENFRELRLYADADNRRLTHQRGRYHESVFAYNPVNSTNNDHPLTSIFNFTTDDTYDNSHPLPDFMGFRINFQGLTQPAEFYAPNYDWEPEPEETDYRRTVYWNPQVTTDRQGRAHIEFFNNGFSQTLKVSAEGITANGLPVVSRDEERGTRNER
jgi:hypothetical protein